MTVWVHAASENNSHDVSCSSPRSGCMCHDVSSDWFLRFAASCHRSCVVNGRDNLICDDDSNSELQRPSSVIFNSRTEEYAPRPLIASVSAGTSLDALDARKALHDQRNPCDIAPYMSRRQGVRICRGSQHKMPLSKVSAPRFRHHRTSLNE